MSLKRILRIGIPFLSIALAVTVYAEIPHPAASCNHPSAMTSFLQSIHLAHTEPCATIPVQGAAGEWCANTGHHCNDGSGPGKCLSVFDNVANSWSCQCVK